jgi:hypothetical protein
MNRNKQVLHLKEKECSSVGMGCGGRERRGRVIIGNNM